MSIYLIGDGILDNFKYLEDKELDLRKEISNFGYEVHNFAKEEMKLVDVLNGYQLTDRQIKSRNYPYQVDKHDNKLQPLTLLNKFNNVNSSPSKGNMAIISIGGNDVNERFMNILLGVDYFMNAILTPIYKENYENMIKSVQISCEKIILISIYLPYLGVGSSYSKYVNYSEPIMKKWNDFIYELAKKYNIPVLDLNKTLNNTDRSHYGTNDTRLSNSSSKCIAKCIKYIYNHYEGHHVYYSTNCNCSKIYKMKET